MSRFLRSTLSEIIYQTGRWMKGHRAGLRILTYHRVTDAHPGDRLCVPVAHFEEQMRALREAGYRTITMTEAVGWMIAGRKQEVGSRKQEVGGWKMSVPTSNFQLPTSSLQPPTSEFGRAIVITFDDGYADNYLHAYPAMARYGFVGVFFVPTQFLQEPPPAAHPDDRPMSWANLEELLKAGHEIGSHSVTHRLLTSLHPDEVEREVRESKRVLEQQLQRPIESFCYPAGDYNALVKRAVEASGYLTACTVEPGANASSADPFALKRTEVSAFDTPRDFQKKLAGAYDALHRAVQRRRAVRNTPEAGSRKLEVGSQMTGKTF